MYNPLIDQFDRNIKKHIEAENLEKALERLNRYKPIFNSDPFNLGNFYAPYMFDSSYSVCSYKSYILPSKTISDYYVYIGKAFYNLDQYYKSLDCFDRAIKVSPGRVILYCNKAKILNILELEEEASYCLNQAFEISEHHNEHRYDYPSLTLNITTCGSYGSGKFEKYIPKGEEIVLKNLAKLQKITAKGQKVIDKLTPNKLKIQEAIEQFKVLKKSKISITIKVVDNFEKGINKEEEVNLLKEIKDMQVELKMMEQRLHDLQEEKEATTIKIQELQTEINIIQKEESEDREIMTETAVHLTKQGNLHAKRLAIVERKVEAKLQEQNQFSQIHTTTVFTSNDSVGVNDNKEVVAIGENIDHDDLVG
ncbi:MAG TPA: hypothetical protein LFW20_02235 [Rickettsia endosymbiont of Omalisus fontisbellaquei]|nr:hypothetical protein [Rickettsia endosymbiont of Omalisus fontisbellaquei]